MLGYLFLDGLIILQRLRIAVDGQRRIENCNGSVIQVFFFFLMAVTCGQVDASLASCIPYLISGGNPAAACCEESEEHYSRDRRQTGSMPMC